MPTPGSCSSTFAGIPRGYKNTHLLQVTIDQVAQTGQIIDTAVNQGANSISGIEFSLSYPDFYYNQALSLALRNAQQKAVTISNSLGISLNQIPIEILEPPQTKTPIPSPGTFYSLSTVTSIEPGKLQITAIIRAKFSYIS